MALTGAAWAEGEMGWIGTWPGVSETQPDMYDQGLAQSFMASMFHAGFH